MIEELTKNEIKDIFSGAVYRRGLNYYLGGHVGDLFFDPERGVWEAEVKGSKTYHVEIAEDEDGISAECDCPAHYQYSQPCKHVAAVILKIKETSSNPLSSFQEEQRHFQEWERRQKELIQREEERLAKYTKEQTQQFIQNFSHSFFGRNEQEVEKSHTPLLVDWILKLGWVRYTSKICFTLEMKVGQQRTYVVKDLKDFLKAVQWQRQYTFTKNFSYDPTEQEFNKEDHAVVQLLQNAIKYQEIYTNFQGDYMTGPRASEKRALVIPPILANEILSKLENRPIRFEVEGSVYDQITLIQDTLPFTLRLDNGVKEGFQLDLTSLSELHYIDLYGYIIQGNTLYQLSDEQDHLIRELKQVTTFSNHDLLPIANDQIESFISQVVPKITKVGQLEITETVSNKILRHPLHVKVYVDRVDDILNVKVAFEYGEMVIHPFEPPVAKIDGPILMRDAEKEQGILEIIESTSLKVHGNHLYVDGEEEIFEFLYETLPLMEDKAEVFLTQSVKSLFMQSSHSAVTTIDVDTSADWLNVSFDIEGIEEEEIKHILQSVIEKKKYYRLPNGAFVSLESESYQTIRNVVEEFKIKKTQLNKETIQLPIYRGMQLDDLANNASGSTKYGKQFRKFLNRLKDAEDHEYQLPESLHAELRDYQNYGFQWLKTLKDYRLGGILADDMGLGKTLQSIAYLLSEKESNKDIRPALIVAPASLVYNWKNECHKFAPSLSADVMIGTPQERMEKMKTDDLPDVWITSYPTLRQDSEFYQQLEFSTLILDEAQAIKNHATKTAKAVREIQATTRFALSGTPIENSIDELWSIFQTIMPDFFPGQKAFRQFEPEKVARMIRPFLLRRLKKDVLTELPDKIETVHYSELTNHQKQLYLAYLEKIQKESKESLQDEGFQKNRIKILAGLTRLRQLCCHPSLFLEKYNGDSGKLEQLMEIVHNAVENGKRILIFSQFTSMLAIIRDRLKEEGFDHFYLDGQTAPKNRVEMVDQFNQGEGELFLISLKAGNTGLNLTGADTVILYDLWWNPAVEEQAAGRAHRIGQKNVVQVIRLITQGTIEEKIFELQQNKKELIETVVQPGDKAISTITEQEIREILNI